MDGLLNNPVLPGIISGLVVTSIVAITTVVFRRIRKPTMLSLYRRALRTVSADLQLSHQEQETLKTALHDTRVLEAINSAAFSPREEATRWRNAMMRAQAGAAQAGAAQAGPVQDQRILRIIAGLMRAEHIEEGKRPEFADRMRYRQPYFAAPPAPEDLSASAHPSGYVSLFWNRGPREDNGPVPYRYHIFRSSGDDDFIEIDAVDAANQRIQHSYRDAAAASNGPYYYEVAEESMALIPGPKSARASLAPSRAPLPPQTTEDRSPGAFFLPTQEIEGLAQRCVGRLGEIDRLKTSFFDTTYHHYIIEGFGGVGKTTLAAQLAVRAQERYEVLWIACRGIPVTAERFLLEMGRYALATQGYSKLAALVENTAMSLEEKVTGLIRFLEWNADPAHGKTHRPIALFFDDYYLVNDVALNQLVLRLGLAVPDMKIVYMTRDRNKLPLTLLSDVAATPPLLLKGLSLEDCRAYLHANAAKYPVLGSLSDEIIERIWVRTGEGVPAALNILVSMTATSWSLEDVLKRLPDYDPLQERIYKQWFEALFNEISPVDRRVATEAALFRRTFPRTALLAIDEEPDVNEAIDELTGRFILNFDGAEYSMHLLWSDYARKTLSHAESSALHRRLAEYYLNAPITPSAAYRWYHAHSILEACYHLTRADAIEEAVTTLTSIATPLREWGLLEELKDILGQLETAFHERGQAVPDQLSLIRASILYSQGDVETAKASLDQLAHTATGATRIEALQVLAQVFIDTGERSAARGLLQQSGALAHLDGLVKQESEAYRGLQAIAWLESDYDEALKLNDQRLSLLQASPGQLTEELREELAVTYRDIGTIHRERGQFTEARRFYELDSDIIHTIGDPPLHLGWSLYNRGRALLEEGQPEAEAYQLLTRALALFNGVPYMYGAAHAMIDLGFIDAQSEPAKGLAGIQRGIELLHEIKGATGEAYGLRVQGAAYVRLNEPEKALRSLERSLSMDERVLHGKKGIALTLSQMALAHEQIGDRLKASGQAVTAACSEFAQAAELLRRTSALYEELKVEPNTGHVRDAIARIAGKQC